MSRVGTEKKFLFREGLRPRLVIHLVGRDDSFLLLVSALRRNNVDILCRTDFQSVPGQTDWKSVLQGTGWGGSRSQVHDERVRRTSRLPPGTPETGGFSCWRRFRYGLFMWETCLQEYEDHAIPSITT